MTDVKICGITNLDDALAACDCGAEALGFIFFKSSPRYVSPEEAGDIIAKLPGGVAKVGVFVNEEPAVVKSIYDSCGLGMIQIHGNESVEYCRGFSSHLLIKALNPWASKSFPELDEWTPHAFLVDSGDAVKYGGTGDLSDWEFAKDLARRYPVILAGGLNPKNVGRAIRTVSPAAVDVGSGVEREPGKKDHGKIRSFIERVRAAGSGGRGGIFEVNS
ncbi:MAG: phosphoribosylanthranilate isomerase [Deltaproteobacteria bacterium HGW-Deltaproteobacteria-21]|nr:MAG: phosphoribosylanthranilate isomerase [Deltaproteobacteria bacterium HGW-Deltaproteobacteria-21]